MFVLLGISCGCLVGPLFSEEAGVPHLFHRSESKTRSSQVVASA